MSRLSNIEKTCFPLNAFNFLVCVQNHHINAAYVRCCVFYFVPNFQKDKKEKKSKNNIRHTHTKSLYFKPHFQYFPFLMLQMDGSEMVLYASHYNGITHCKRAPIYPHNIE